MESVLGCDRERELLARGFSRRDFFKVASLMGAAASLPFYGEAALAQLSQVGGHAGRRRADQRQRESARAVS